MRKFTKFRKAIRATYTFHEPPVGVGAFSQVFRATNKETNEVRSCPGATRQKGELRAEAERGGVRNCGVLRSRRVKGGPSRRGEQRREILNI
jgi:hypothetical protein